MGMFDTVSVIDPLPVSPEMEAVGLNRRSWELQTKQLDNLLDMYVLQNGQLHIQKYKVCTWVLGDPKSKDIIGQLGRISRKEPYLEKVDWTGEMDAYDYRRNVMGKWDCYCRWKITFVHGIAKTKMLSEFEKTDNAPRLARENKWKKEVERRAKLWRNKYFFHTKLYRKVSNKIRWSLYAIGNWLPLA